jgi:FMN phosphatase YigB (HAD superfamily)
MKVQPDEALHVGDDPERDWKAASTAGLAIFRLERGKNSLSYLIQML